MSPSMNSSAYAVSTTRASSARSMPEVSNLIPRFLCGKCVIAYCSVRSVGVEQRCTDEHSAAVMESRELGRRTTATDEHDPGKPEAGQQQQCQAAEGEDHHAPRQS